MTINIGRRELLAMFGAAAAAWPLAGRAQQAATPVIGFLGGTSATAAKAPLIGLRQGLRQTGYIEGQNTHIAFRWADDRLDRFPELAAELVSLPVGVIAAIGTPAASAAISVTKTIPIVFASGSDPARLGLVARAYLKIA
jgi:putative tryptophan/tyrosine transport system substrate-binding protein